MTLKIKNDWRLLFYEKQKLQRHLLISLVLKKTLKCAYQALRASSMRRLQRGNIPPNKIPREIRLENRPRCLDVTNKKVQVASASSRTKRALRCLWIRASGHNRKVNTSTKRQVLLLGIATITSTLLQLLRESACLWELWLKKRRLPEPFKITWIFQMFSLFLENTWEA